MDELDDFLDERIGSDPDLLPHLLESLRKERDELEQQLRGEVAVEGDNTWKEVVLQVKEVISQLEDVKTACLQLSGEGDEGVRLGRGEVGECADDLRGKAQELLQAQHLLAYLNWLLKILELSSRIEEELSPGGDLSVAVGYYGDLVAVVTQLESSSCRHLVEYSRSCLLVWGERLRDRAVSDFTSVLADLHWPFSSSSVSYSLHDQNEPFSKLFHLLIKLDPLHPMGGHTNLGNHGKNMDDPLLYPVEQLLQPLRRRFHYHFMEERRTNSLEKPEWCFTHMSSWIRSHTPFLESQVQPLLEAADLNVDAVVEFTRGLLQEVEIKLRRDVVDVVQDDLLMAHLIDELLLFTRELTLLGYPPSSPSPLTVLLNTTSFSKWIALERQFAEERLLSLSASPSAWSPVYEASDDTDDTRVPEVAESLLTLIAGITDRYRSLPSEVHQLKFVGLQRDLLLDFLHDLVSTGAAGAGGSLSPLPCSHLNACSYIAAVLREWGEMKFFVSLHYSELDLSMNPDSDHTLSPPVASRPDINTIIQLRRQDSAFADMEGHIFSPVVAEFRTHSGVLQDRLVQQVVNSFRTGLKRYRREDWQDQSTRGGEEAPWQDLSPSLSIILPQLHGQLGFLRDHLSYLQFASVVQRVANHIDQLLFSEVILPTHFGVGGASQLNFDLTSGFLPVLSQFCEDLLARQLMERSRESCRLLSLLPGSAKLLQELLVGVVRGGVTTPIETYTAAVTTLNEFGVHTLEPVQAYQILSNMLVQT